MIATVHSDGTVELVVDEDELRTIEWALSWAEGMANPRAVAIAETIKPIFPYLEVMRLARTPRRFGP